LGTTFKEMFNEIYEYRELLKAFTLRNIQMKYKQTMMGFLWAIFMPSIIALSGMVIKIIMANLSGHEVNSQEVASVSVKALAWAFFVGALKFSVNSLVANMDLVKKIYFPREIFPFSYTLGQLFDLAVSSVAFAIILSFMKVGISIYILWLPVLILFLFLLTAGLGLLLSCANLFYRDVRYIVDVLLTFGIFFTPVFFDADMFGKSKLFLLLNPIGSLLECLNHAVVLHQMPSVFWLSYAGIVSVLCFWISWYIFHQLEPLFAEKI
jgi:lipopolysaccharide transport system permease protein